MNPNSIVIGFVGRLLEAKNVAFLLTVFATLDFDSVQLRVYLLILGLYQRELERLNAIRELYPSLLERVVFLQATDNVAKVLVTIDIFYSVQRMSRCQTLCLR